MALKPVTIIRERVSEDVKKVVDWLHAESEKGKLQGIVVSVKRESWEHDVYIAGDYRRDPAGALGAGVRMVSTLNRYVDAQAQADPGWDKCAGCRYNGF